MKNILCVLLVAGLLSAGGCMGRAIKEGMGAVTGAKGMAIVIKPVSPSKHDVSLEDYGQFKLETFSNAFGGAVPSAA